MSLKTTNKEARLAIRQYILDHFDPCGYDFTGPCSFPNVARFILSVHAKEKAYSPEYQSRKGYTNEQVFIDWCQGLPSILDTCYYYNRSAVADLGGHFATVGTGTGAIYRRTGGTALDSFDLSRISKGGGGKMKQYTRKQLKEYARLGLARDLTTVDPDTLPKWYEKIGVSRGIYGMNGGLIWDKVTGEYGVILARSSNLFRLF